MRPRCKRGRVGVLALNDDPFDDGNGSRPYAYLSYMFLNEDLNYVDQNWIRVPANAEFDSNEETDPYKPHRKMTLPSPAIATQRGYVYIWLSNLSQDTEVWFDDLSVSHNHGIVTQAMDYRAWGDVIREQKYVSSEEYRYGYQGQFAEKDEETGWNHFELREYDPIIGRWMAVDPASQFYSPYLSMGNNPVNTIDPDGAWGISYEGLQYIQSAVNYFTSGYMQEAHNREGAFDEWSNVSALIQVADFVGWGSLASGKDCMDYSVAQLAKMNITSNSRIRIYTATENGVTETIAATDEAQNGINTIHEMLDKGQAIIVGVHYKYNAGINEKPIGTTDHWLVIVGRGRDENGGYFLFYDNYTGNSNYGASLNNKFRPQSGNLLQGSFTKPSGTINNYTVSQVRPNN